MATSKSWMYISSTDFDHQIADLARALGHPARIRILRYLIDHGPSSPKSLRKTGPLSRATMSHHLKVLRERYWVTFEENGPYAMYGLNGVTYPMFRDLFTTLMDDAINSAGNPKNKGASV